MPFYKGRYLIRTEDEIVSAAETPPLHADNEVQMKFKVGDWARNNDEFFDDRLDAIVEVAGIDEVSPPPPYIVSESWEHIWSNGKMGVCRWVYDMEKEDLIKLQLLDGENWEEASSDAHADVLDSLHNSNSDLFDDPTAYGNEFADELPEWAE